jgi:uncharacterized membrane protein (DUF373 family)
MHHRVALDGVLEVGLLGLVRQLAVLEQVGDFEEVQFSASCSIG